MLRLFKAFRTVEPAQATKSVQVECFNPTDLKHNEWCAKIGNTAYVKIRVEGSTAYQTLHLDGLPVALLSGRADYKTCLSQINRLLSGNCGIQVETLKGLKKFLKGFNK